MQMFRHAPDRLADAAAHHQIVRNHPITGMSCIMLCTEPMFNTAHANANIEKMRLLRWEAGMARPRGGDAKK
jgi:hypothetical protein